MNINAFPSAPPAQKTTLEEVPGNLKSLEEVDPNESSFAKSVRMCRESKEFIPETQEILELLAGERPPRDEREAVLKDFNVRFEKSLLEAGKSAERGDRKGEKTEQMIAQFLENLDHLLRIYFTALDDEKDLEEESGKKLDSQLKLSRLIREEVLELFSDNNPLVKKLEDEVEYDIPQYHSQETGLQQAA